MQTRKRKNAAANLNMKQIKELMQQDLTDRQIKLLTVILFQKAMNGNIAALKLILQILGEI